MSCPAYGKECRKCLRKNHFARCCRNIHQDAKSKPIRATWRACESESDCEVEGESVGHVYKLHDGRHERVIVKINGQSVNFVIDTGSSSMIITKQEYLKLNKNEENSLKHTNIKLTPYGSSDTLKVIGK